MSLSLFGLAPATWVPHALHREERAFGESNCYVDLWIEVLHALRLDPVACLPFTLGTDFEGDQWTFFKPPLSDLRDLYGIEVEELNCWRPLLDHAVEQLKLGRLVLTEADSFFLPDTAGTDYRAKHTKTTIALEMIDREGRRLHYFHNGGYHALAGEDFQRVFTLPGNREEGSAFPFYAEMVKLGRVIRLSRETLAERSFSLFQSHLARRLDHNPVRNFAARLPGDIDWLRGQPLETYHAWAFAGLRQCGASFELLARYLRWLGANGQGEFESAASDFDRISSTAKTFILKGARAATTGRAVDFSTLLGEMAGSWESGIGRLVASQGG